MAGPSRRTLLGWTLRLLVPLAGLLTTYLYLYPVFLGCAFPLPPADGGPGANTGTAAWFDTLQRHVPVVGDTSEAAAHRLAPFRLLALGDPQLEGDTSIPNAHGDSFPHLWTALAYATFSDDSSSGDLSLRERTRLLLHDVVDFWFEDVPNTVTSIRKRIDLRGNDFYLAHIYRTMHWWTAPSHVAVLGDLVGSQWIDDDEFARRANRYWHRVLRGSERVPDELALYPAEEYNLSGYLGGGGQPTRGADDDEAVRADPWPRRILNVVGNHDIGYAGDITMERMARFEEQFGRANYELRFELPLAWLGLNETALVVARETTPDRDAETDADADADADTDAAATTRLVPELRIVLLNDMNLDTPAQDAGLQDETYAFINAVINTASAVEFQGQFTVILTHVPLYKPEGTCVDAPYFAFGDDDADDDRTGLLTEQNQLSADASRGFLEGILGMHADPHAPGAGRGRPGVILNGHDHAGCDTFHFINQSREVPEWETVRWAAEGAALVGLPGLPGVRELTVRSMMGDFGGNAGLLSAWFDTDTWTWQYEFATCAVGRQHLWWVAHVVDALVLGGLLAYGVLWVVERTAASTAATAPPKQTAPARVTPKV